MIIVKVKNGKIDAAVKAWKNKVKNTKLVKRIKENEEYVKPSVKRRNTISKAKFKQKRSFE